LNDSSKSRLVNDIENRLDDFFGQSEEKPTNSPKTSLEKLKTIVLNIDWEITDACLDALIGEAEILLPQYERDRMAHALLRMLKSLGRYIRKRKAQAHPDAIKRILSVYESFEKIACDHNIEEILKQKILSKEINAFKKLKQQVDIRRPTESVSAEKGPGIGFIDHQRLEQAMSVVEQRLRIEVEALKNQLDNLQHELNLLRKA
jgi:hypothetical protein